MCRSGKRRRVVCPADFLRRNSAASGRAGGLAHAIGLSARPAGDLQAVPWAGKPRREYFIDELIPSGIGTPCKNGKLA